MNDLRDDAKYGQPLAGSAPPGDSDEELELRAGRDQEAFIALYERHIGKLHSYVSWKVGAEDAEDVVAEVIMRAIEGIAGFRGDSSFKTWLFGIARRTIAQHFRSRAKGASSETLDIFYEFDVEETYVANERAELLRALVSQLGEPYREVIELRYWAGMETSEINDVNRLCSSQEHGTLCPGPTGRIR